MIFFVAIVDGHIPIVHAFMGEDGKSQSVNGDRYQQLIKDVAWPALRGKAARRNYWWMQDGAPPDCTNAAKKFLLEKFKGRVLSRGTAVSWTGELSRFESVGLSLLGRSATAGVP